jgi:hypothetical protein
MIEFRGADINQVIHLYSELLGGKLDRRHFPIVDCPYSFVFLLTETPLTKSEAIYAMKTLISWHGYELVASSNGMLQVVISSNAK